MGKAGSFRGKPASGLAQVSERVARARAGLRLLSPSAEGLVSGIGA